MTHAAQMNTMPQETRDLPRAAQVTFLEGYKKAQAADPEATHEKCCDAGWSEVSKKFSQREGDWTPRTREHGDADDEDEDDDESNSGRRKKKKKPTFDSTAVTLTDALEFDDAAGVHYTADGYLVASPRVARAGIQIYKGREIGKPNLEEVRVYRPAKEVFSRDSLRSYGHRPIVVDHPRSQVTSKTWREHAVGQTGEEVVRDGSFVRIPMMLMDENAIERFRGGKDQLSVGYSADIEWSAGVTDSGERYDAVQRNITANHLAIVASARGGPQLRIGDDTRGEELMKTIVVDGISVQIEDTAAAIVSRALEDAASKIEKSKKKLADAETEHGATQAKLADAEKSVQTKDGEITALKKQLDDSKVTPQQLDKLVASRLAVVGKAKVMLGDSFQTEGKTEAEIRRAVVTSKLTDAVAKEMSDAAIEGAFAAFAASAPTGTQRLAASLSDGRPVVHSAQQARDVAYDKHIGRLQNAWKGEKSTA